MLKNKIYNPTDGAESIIYKNIILDPIPGTDNYCVQVNYPGMNKVEILSKTVTDLNEALLKVFNIKL